MDCNPPGSSVHGISQARILEWVDISFSRGSSNPEIEHASHALEFFTTHQGSPSRPVYCFIFNKWTKQSWFIKLHHGFLTRISTFKRMFFTIELFLVCIKIYSNQHSYQASVNSYFSLKSVHNVYQYLLYEPRVKSIALLNNFMYVCHRRTRLMHFYFYFIMHIIIVIYISNQ